jgi:hypothetical protein
LHRAHGFRHWRLSVARWWLCWCWCVDDCVDVLHVDVLMCWCVGFFVFYLFFGTFSRSVNSWSKPNCRVLRQQTIFFSRTWSAQSK